jgi:putative Holliday junction resolvase
MRIMSLDIGSKTIGVAVCDPLGITAQGIKTIRRENIKKDISEILSVIEEYGVEKIVAGYPKKLDGTPGPMCEEVDRVCNKLSKRADKEIIYQDERFTTSAAQRVLLEADVSRAKRKQVVDTVAATFILQTYLDSINK